MEIAKIQLCSRVLTRRQEIDLNFFFNLLCESCISKKNVFLGNWKICGSNILPHIRTLSGTSKYFAGGVSQSSSEMPPIHTSDLGYFAYSRGGLTHMAPTWENEKNIKENKNAKTRGRGPVTICDRSSTFICLKETLLVQELLY